jgi:hypothetical protein
VIATTIHYRGSNKIALNAPKPRTKNLLGVMRNSMELLYKANKLSTVVLFKRLKKMAEFYIVLFI